MEMKNKLLIATHNQAKFEQIRDYLRDIPYELISLSDIGITYDVEETGKTFVENALLKAQIYAQMSSLLTLADDSGLQIDALNGEPGIYSARYAGPNKTNEEKMQFILDKMQNIPIDKRQAQFVSCMVLAWPNGKVKIYEGQSMGLISMEPRGKSRYGFPYYRIYILDRYGKTIAELEEQQIPYESHRQQSLRQVADDLKSLAYY
ncbi:MAG: RdgB/HAM1 family non-canonical purine NTP pyrophosphatase [Candidatus Babeliales bacterium]